jgi:hypothetical protein
MIHKTDFGRSTMTQLNTEHAEREAAQELLRRLADEAPELIRAAGEVDQFLLERAASLSPVSPPWSGSKQLPVTSLSSVAFGLDETSPLS